MYVCMYVEAFMEHKKLAKVFLLDKKSVNMKISILETLEKFIFPWCHGWNNNTQTIWQ